jgi:hypothetical protein
MKKSQPSVPKVSVPAGSPSGSKSSLPAVFGGASILRAVRTTHAKAVRRIYGDRGGHCRFSDRFLLPATDGCSNTITGIQKDNLLLVEYALD